MGESLSLGSMCIDAGTENISSAQLPATLPAQKKNFVFPWDMEIKGPYLHTWTVTGAGACILGYEPPPRPGQQNTKHTP